MQTFDFCLRFLFLSIFLFSTLARVAKSSFSLCLHMVDLFVSLTMYVSVSLLTQRYDILLCSHNTPYT